MDYVGLYEDLHEELNGSYSCLLTSPRYETTRRSNMSPANIFRIWTSTVEASNMREFWPQPLAHHENTAAS
jgi:hypothetical protein